MTSPLFSPVTLGAVSLANRIVVAPMCQYSADDGSATDWHLQHLGSLALSGAALLMIEATAVERQGRITHGCLGLYSDANEAALGRVLALLRSIGCHAKVGIQLAHAGRKGSAQRPWEGGQALKAEAGAYPTVAPSALPFDASWHTPAQLDAAGMGRIKDAFVSAARRAARLGLDAVELHAAHGYLLQEFFSPLANRREDAYGGDLEGRMRFPLEIAAAVREVWPEARMLGARISGSDWLEGGATTDDAVVLARRLKALGFDYVCVSSGGVVPKAVPKPLVPGYQVPFAARVRKEAGIATRAVGMIVHPRQAEDVIASGQADMVALARGFLDDPRWVWHAAQALGVEIAYPPQYGRAHPKAWPGAALVRPPLAAAKKAALGG
jgi:2,4-dienoyl-CoA reductase-like NADH-dependent reductase (Old Yellow Enzyme family)